MDFYRLFCAYIGMCNTLLNLSEIDILMQNILMQYINAV